MPRSKLSAAAAQPAPVMVFSHANSFPAATYQRLFAHLRDRGFAVSAIERFGHDERYPVSNNWPHLVQQLSDHIRSHAWAQKPWLVGHSLGGYLSVMAASQLGDAVAGVVLLDAPVLGGWKATTLGVIKRTQLVGSVSPGRISHRRRDHWPSRAEAHAHFQSKKAFARWQAEVLADYVDAFAERDGAVWLPFDRAVETAIYNTLPDNLDALLRRHPLKCPVAFVGGLRSAEMARVGMEMTQRLTKGRITWLDGSHLFPMERPAATAAAIEASILNLRGA